MGAKCEIAIIIPVFNEQQTITKVLEDIDRSLSEPVIVYLIADSVLDPTILTAELAAYDLSINVRTIIQNGTRGPGSALKLGIEASREKYVVFMTADDSDDTRDIPKLVASLRDGAMVACASRYATGGKHIGGPRLKHFLSWLAGRAAQIVKRLSTCDPTNLFKAVRREFLDQITIESKFGFTLGLEIVGKANASRYQIGEIPTIWHERSVGESNFKVVKWLPTYVYWFMRLLVPRWLVNLNELIYRK
jgi:glycosyltransferase involved in cell wall biosynthesis